MSKTFDPFTPFAAQQCKTVRELRLESLLVRCRPVVVEAEMSPSTSAELRELLADIEIELPTTEENHD